MRHRFWIYLLFALGVWGVSQARAASICNSTSGNVVTNCGFETGSFSGWTVSGNLYGGINGNYVGVDNANPNSGNYEAYFGAPSQFGQTESGNKYGPVTTLSQTVAALPGQYYEVSFYLDNNGCSVSNNPGCGNYYNYFDAYFDGVKLTQQYNLPYSGAYDEYVFVVPTTGGSHPYNTDLLKFDFTNDDDLFYFDDVSVNSLGKTPEPASFLLVAPVLGGLWLARRRRKS
jgi:MYXO-CTERM domain-containing protein